MKWSVAVLLIMLPSVSVAQQQPVCDQTKKMYHDLKTQWKEARRAVGTVKGNNKVILEIWTSNETYSVFITFVHGVSCLVVVGENLEWEKNRDAVEENESLSRPTP